MDETLTEFLISRMVERLEVAYQDTNKCMTSGPLLKMSFKHWLSLVNSKSGPLIRRANEKVIVEIIYI